MEAYDQIEELLRDRNDLVIVLDNNCWQQGIIGIVSSRITEKYGLPSILISFDGACAPDSEDPMDDGKGSGRSVKGLNLVEALNACEDLLIKYGGHELAAGLTIKRGNLEEFRARINEYARRNLNDDIFKIRMEADFELEMRDVTMAFAQELSLLEPFGVGNASPTFMMRNACVKKLTPIGGGKHSRLLLEKDGICVTALYFGMGESELGFEAGDTVDVLFTMDINDYRNQRTVQLILQDARLSKDFSDRLAEQKERYAALCRGESFSVEEDLIPGREDFAEVYKILRREFRNGTSVLDQKTLMKLINGTPNHAPISYVKLKYILRILNELRICEIEELEEDLYRFSVIFQASKTNIEKSSILKKLKSQCIFHA